MKVITLPKQRGRWNAGATTKSVCQPSRSASPTYSYASTPVCHFASGIGTPRISLRTTRIATSFALHASKPENASGTFGSGWYGPDPAQQMVEIRAAAYNSAAVASPEFSLSAVSEKTYAASASRGGVSASAIAMSLANNAISSFIALSLHYLDYT